MSSRVISGNHVILFLTFEFIGHNKRRSSVTWGCVPPGNLPLNTGAVCYEWKKGGDTRSTQNSSAGVRESQF